MTATLPAAPAAAVQPTPPSPAARRWPYRVFLGALAVAVAVGVVVRFTSRGDLWLDEALTVNISSLPPRQLFAALKVDGSPPLYYLLLHVWISLFGSGTAVVRTFSGIVSTLALVPAWFIGRRLGGQRLAAVTVVLLATAPFTLRYGSETRMYSLVLLEVCLGGIALLRAVARPTVKRLAPFTLAVLALAFTHYWSFFLLIAVAIGLLVARKWRLVGAMVAAGILFTPQLPTLLFQAKHTGTPWAPAAMPRAVIDTLLAWGGPVDHGFAAPLGFVMIVVALVGAVTVRTREGALLVEPRKAVVGGCALGLSLGPLVIAVAFTIVGHAGFVERYTAIAVPAWALLVGLGVLRLGGRTGGVLLLAMAVVGLMTGTSDALHVRTQAGQIAAQLAISTQPGDLVVYCPDQLAPAVHRVIPPGRTEVSYGDDLGPTRVDWVDYAQRNASLDPQLAATDYNLQAGPTHAIALVWAEGYKTLEGQCSALADQLGALRPGSAGVVGRDPGQGESANVTVYPGATQLAATPFGLGPAVPVK